MKKNPSTLRGQGRPGWRPFCFLLLLILFLLAGVRSARAFYPIFDNSAAKNMAMKPDPRVARHSLTVSSSKVTVGDKVEVEVQIVNPDDVELKRLRVRFTCGTQRKDVFINLRPRDEKVVRVEFTTRAPTGVQKVKVEVNPNHGELRERDYGNNTAISRILVTGKLVADGISTANLKHHESAHQVAQGFPVITGVTPNTLSPGQEYTLRLQGNYLSREMELDLGEGIRITRTPQFYDTFLLVPVAVDARAASGRRHIVVTFQGQRKTQMPTIVLESVAGTAGLKITPSVLESGKRYTLDLKGQGLSQDMTVVLDGALKALGGLEILGDGEARLEVLVNTGAPPGRHPVVLKGQGSQGPSLMVASGRELRGYVEVKAPEFKLSTPKLSGAVTLVTIPSFYQMKPNRWVVGEKYMVTLEGSNLTGIKGIYLGHGVKVKDLKHQGEDKIEFTLEVDKNADPVVRLAVLEVQEGQIQSSLKGWVVARPRMPQKLPPLVWGPQKNLNIRQAAIYLLEPEWYYTGEMASVEHPLPVLNDKTVFTWKEEVPGLADVFEIRFFTPKGNLVKSQRILVRPPSPYITSFGPDSAFLMALYQDLFQADRKKGKAPMGKRTKPSLGRGKVQIGAQIHLLPPIFHAKTGGKKRLRSKVKRQQEKKGDIYWQVVGYKRVVKEPMKAREGGKEVFRSRPVVGSLASKVERITELVEIEVSEKWPLRLPRSGWSSGPSCDARNEINLTVDCVHPPGWDQGDPNCYPGDLVKVSGTFSLKDSPWAISADTNYSGHENIVRDESYRFNNVIVDWGDGVHWTPLEAKAVKSSLPGWSEADVMSFKAQHKYDRPGRFMVRIYVVPQDQMGNIAQIVAAHGYHPPPETQRAGKTSSSKRRRSFYSMAPALPPKGSSMEMADNRIFMLYCNTADITIVQDTAATGPLHLESIGITSFSADEGAAPRTPGMVALSPVTKVSSCDGGLWARATLKYYGQGYARVKWMVDGVEVASKEVKLGPSTLRKNLGTDPSSWGNPLVSDYTLESPRLPIKDLGSHKVKVAALVVPDPTWSRVNAVALKTSLASFKTQGKKLPPLIIPKGGLKPAFIPVSRLEGNNTWGRGGVWGQLKRTSSSRMEMNYPPFAVISSVREYLVTRGEEGRPCQFLFPTQEGDFQVAGLKGLTAQGTTYSGRGLFIFKLPDGPFSTAEHYLPISFNHWKVAKGEVVKEGLLASKAGENLDNLPGVTATLTNLQGKAGDHVKAVMDVTIKDPILRLAGGEKPQGWKGVSSVLTPQGDWYATGLALGFTRIGWSLTGIESREVTLDFSHTQGESPSCGYGGAKWVGVNLGRATLHPYLMGLADVPLEVKGWAITDSGICGHGETGGFSHPLGDATVGWSRLTVDAFNGTLVTQYDGFYVDMAWPRFHLKGGKVRLSYSPGSKTDFHLDISGSEPVTEHYQVIDMKVTPKALVHTARGWEVQADGVFTFRDEEGGIFAQGVTVNDLFFSLDSQARCQQGTIPLNIKGQVGGADELVTSMTVFPTKGDQKLTLDFTTEFSMEGLGRSEEPVHIIYWIKKPAGGKAYSAGPQHPMEIVLKSHFPEADPVVSNEYKIEYSPGSKKASGSGRPRYASNGEYASTVLDGDRMLLAGEVSLSGGGCGNDTFGGRVNSHIFGDQSPVVEGTFRFGKTGGEKYWLAFIKGDNLSILISSGIWLEMVQGGLAYNFNHDAFTKDGGFNACPAPGKGILFSSGLGLSFGGKGDVVRGDGVLTVQPSDAFYEFLVRAVLLKKADLKGRIRYHQSSFDGEVWGNVSLLNGQIYLEAREHSTGIHVDSGSWNFHIGTESDYVRGHLTKAVNGGAYMVLGNHEGFKVGAKVRKDVNLGDSSLGVKGWMEVSGGANLTLKPLSFDGVLRGDIGGRFVNPVKDINFTVGVRQWVGCCNPVKCGYGFTVGCCCVDGGADVYILPKPGTHLWAGCSCCDPTDWF